jgi:hypothetical protein
MYEEENQIKETSKMRQLAGALKKNEKLLACVYFWSSQNERPNNVIPLSEK